MTPEQAIQTALEYETRIRDLYLEAVESTGNAKGKGVFQKLADDEQGHVDYLNHRLEEWTREGRIRLADLTSSIPPADTIRREAEKLRETAQEDDHGLEQQMLAKALKMEVETSRFYRDMVERMSGDYREMFARFLEIEDNHVEAVQFELDHVGRTGFWYGFEEFDMEVG